MLMGPSAGSHSAPKNKNLIGRFLPVVGPAASRLPTTNVPPALCWVPRGRTDKFGHFWTSILDSRVSDMVPSSGLYVGPHTSRKLWQVEGEEAKPRSGLTSWGASLTTFPY